MTLYEEVRAALRVAHFQPKKRLGQNFLIHERVIDAILRLLDLAPDGEVVEIGPGLGFLTRRLLDRAARVWAVEVDRALVECLRQSALGSDPKLQLIHGDILTLALADILPQRKIKLAGNLPYSISSPVLFKILGWHEHFSTLVLMVQKEVADRIASAPGRKDYGTLAVWCQLHGRVTDKVAVSPEAFFPRPKVHSTILKIELFAEPRIPPDDLTALRGIVRAAFGQRRKTLANALTAFTERRREEVEAFLRAQDIDPRRRGETLAVEEFVKLARAARNQPLLATDD